MTTRVDNYSGAAAAGTDTGGADARASAPSIRNRTVILYLVLSLAAILPGALAASGIELGAGAVLTDMLATLSAALADIRFGSGVRFWLGVAGATIMGLLLLYPLRKVAARRRGIGSVGGWFHLHIVLGFLGPVLIGYHCNFGLGGTNANVALWSMLVVVASGLIGQFVYAHVSARFYEDKKTARAHLDHIRDLLVALDAAPVSRARLIEALDAYEARQMMPRQGIVAGLSNRFGVEKQRRRFARDLAQALADAVRERGLTAVEHQRLRHVAGQHLAGYFRIARRASSRAVREQTWARWRLFHMPIFLVMTVATVLHVWAVWDMDTPGAKDAKAAVTGNGAVVPRKSALKQIQVRTTRVDQVAVGNARSEGKSAGGSLDPTVAQSAAASPKAGPGGTGGPADGIGGLLAQLPDEAEPKPATVPAVKKQATARSEKQVAGSSVQPEVPPKTENANPPPISPPRPEPAARPARPASEPIAQAPKAVDAPKSVAAPAPPVAVAKSEPAPAPAKSADDMKPVYAELQKRSETQPMALGGAKPRTLAEQIVAYKARMKAKEFAHSEIETGFALTGKHKGVECADCHKKPLRDTRQSQVRECIDCHKQDDIHRGRRPDCAQCHTTNRWSETRKPK